MDTTNIILTALSTALATGGQAALNDTAKEFFEHLKDRILQAFSGRQKDLMVFEAYEQEPNIWEKPLEDALIKAGLPQDEATVKIAQRLIDLMGPKASMRDNQSIQHHGTGHGSVYGNNYGTIKVSSIDPGKDMTADGKVALARGRDNLWRKEYDAAKQQLETAIKLLSEDQHPSEGAQARYLLALALLKNIRPYSVSYQTFCRVRELLQVAIRLHPTRSYLYTLLLFKQDYARNGFPELTKDLTSLLHQAQQFAETIHDQENIEMLSNCQPQLMQEAQQ